MTPNMLREKPIRKAIEVSARGYTAKVDPIIRDLSNSTQRALRQDLHTFAGFKTYHHLQEVAGRSRNADGTLKSWQEFVADTAKIDDKYNKNWLKAEYAFVQASAQMAAKWERFAQWGDAYDLLYKTAGDEKVRADHARLNGMCLPFSDPAWDTCFPPNGWGCRCDVIQVIPGTHPRSQSEEVVDLMEEMTPGKQEIFRFNPGKEGRLIPPKHPYYGKNGNKERAKIEKNLGDDYIPTKSIIETTKDGHTIELYENVETKKGDFPQILSAAQYFAKNGEDVVILPDIGHGDRNFNYQSIFGDLIGTKYNGKCPDLRCTKDGISVYREVKGYKSKEDGKSALRNMFGDALTQSNKVIMRRHPKWTDRWVKRSVMNRIKNGADIDEVWLQDEDGNLTLLYKNTAG